MTVNIAEARTLVERLREFHLNVRGTLEMDAADTIAALLDKVEHWKAEAESWEKQASDRVDDALKFAAERDALAREREIAVEMLADHSVDITRENAAHFTDLHDRLRELRTHHDALKVANDALARDAARYREFVVSGGWHRHIDGEHPEESYSYLVVGLPVDADLSCYAARKLAMDKVLDEGSER